MPSFVVTVESSLSENWASTCHELVDELPHAVTVAAEEGAKHSREHHPYQDRTYHLTDTTEGKLESVDQEGATAAITWVQDYASYVDKGTSRARAYPFSEEASRVAEEVLEREVAALVARAESRHR